MTDLPPHKLLRTSDSILSDSRAQSFLLEDWPLNETRGKRQRSAVIREERWAGLGPKEKVFMIWHLPRNSSWVILPT